MSVVGVPVCQGVMSDRLATRANKEKQRKTRGYEGNRNSGPPPVVGHSAIFC